MNRGEIWRIPSMRGPAYVLILTSDRVAPVIGVPVVARVVPAIEGIAVGDEPPPSVFAVQLGPNDPCEGWVLVYSQYQPTKGRYVDGDLIGAVTSETMERVNDGLRELYEL